jgi:hypothetical protein
VELEKRREEKRPREMKQVLSKWAVALPSLLRSERKEKKKVERMKISYDGLHRGQIRE